MSRSQILRRSVTSGHLRPPVGSLPTAFEAPLACIDVSIVQAHAAGPARAGGGGAPVIIIAVQIANVPTRPLSPLSKEVR